MERQGESTFYHVYDCMISSNESEVKCSSRDKILNDTRALLKKKTSFDNNIS